tara:strand:+ start:71 stop:556 length:486 start_codon:yes stop_codon:yes gene_type:complete
MSKILVDEIASKTGGTTGLTIDSSGHVSQPQLPAACFHYQGSNLTGAAIVPLNTQSVLQGGMSMSSNAITVPVTGLYRIGWHHLATSSSAFSVFFIRINGTQNSILPHGWATQVQPAGANSNFSVQTIASLSANDTVDFYISSGAIHGNSDYNSMYVYLLG